MKISRDIIKQLPDDTEARYTLQLVSSNHAAHSWLSDLAEDERAALYDVIRTATARIAQQLTAVPPMAGAPDMPRRQPREEPSTWTNGSMPGLRDLPSPHGTVGHIQPVPLVPYDRGNRARRRRAPTVPLGERQTTEHGV